MNQSSSHIQSPLWVIPFVVLSVIFPLPAWMCVLFVCNAFEAVTGVGIQLVGAPGGADPGAVVLTVIYASLCVLIARFFLVHKANFNAVAVTLGGLILSPVVFAMVSSIIWF